VDESVDRHILDFPETDEQHRYLYDLFALLGDNSHVVNTPGTKALLAEIERYILYHFSCEDRLMRTYGFPGAAVHTSDHERVEEKLVQFMDNFEAGNLNPDYMRRFMTHWLSEHGKMADAEYVAWITQRRSAVRSASLSA